MNNAATRKSAPFYRLAQNDNEGRRFYLDGEYRSSAEAIETWASQPRNGTAYVVEMRDVGYGLTAKLVATAGAL